MRLHRFIGNFDLTQKTLSVSDKELIGQLKNVLRLKTGAQVILADGKLNEATAEITNLGKESADFSILKVEKNSNESKVDGTLYLAILKNENFELAVQKAVEVGIKEIIPVITARTVKLNLKRERLEKIIKEAAEQSGRGTVPSLGETMQLADAMKEAKDNDVNFFFQLGAPVFKHERLSATRPERVGIFIGPEGGWDEREEQMAVEKDFKALSLGDMTLRAETAAIVACWVVATASLL